ncbi:MAG TPA: efflux RND transporter periplasmic adaptor subunit [Planctomycetota bacterium]|jgi:HlyD family secretion protein
MRLPIKIFSWLVASAVIGGSGYYGYSKVTATPERIYKTAAVKKGGLVATITATGTVEPEEVVDVGAQVAGQINSFGVDKAGKQVDYGSFVEAGTVLAKIDSALYDATLAQAKAQLDVDRAGVAKAKSDAETAKAKLDQSKADLEQLKAKVGQALTDLDMFKAKQDQTKADVEQFQAKFEQAQRDWARAQKLGPSDVLSQEAFDAYKGVFEAAKAGLASGKAIAVQTKFSIASQESVIAQAQANVASQTAVIAQAQANVVSSEAAIQQAEGVVARDEATVRGAQMNVNYCTIKCPVNGVIIDRRVNIGQTVVASLSAPSLFLLAKDLTRMQVWASMNEADIGNIHPGQPVTFTVDAFPNTTFKGSVRKVRYNATMTQNVVTYTIEVETDNSNGRLLPYLTANALFEVARREDVLLVPNAALRFVPQRDEVAPSALDELDAPRRRPSDARTPPGDGAAEPAKTKAEPGAAKTEPAAGKPERTGRPSRGRVWIKNGELLRPIRVRTGITDGVNTEVTGDELKEDLPVVVGRQLSGETGAAGGTTNPFAPTNPFGRRNSGSASQAQPKKD